MAKSLNKFSFTYEGETYIFDISTLAPKSNPVFTGEAQAGTLSVGSLLKFKAGSVIKVQVGTEGGVPIYREFPATDLASSDLNGTNYVMVYGVGTPEENAAELQAAYNEAKTMPRFIGYLGPTSPTYIYAGQTFGTYIEGSPKYYKVLVDGQYTPYQMSLPEITESEAIPVRTTVIVAPGEYNFGQYTAFNLTATNINVVSLTGKRDVKINNISVQVNYCTVSGIDCSSGSFGIFDSLPNILIENCSGGDLSFGGTTSDGIYVPGTFRNCEGGAYSFGASGTANGKFIDCIGGQYSFGTLAATSILRNCRLLAGTYSNYSAGKVIDCIDGSGAIINNPPIESSGSKIKRVVLDDPQDSVDDPYTYNLTMDDNGATLIVNDDGLTSSGMVIFDFSKFTEGELLLPFVVTVIGIGYVFAAYKNGGAVVPLTSGSDINKTVMLCRDPKVGADTPFVRILG